MSKPDPNIVALGIRQPWAELILRGEKTIEVRSLNTQQRGTIYVYAAKKVAETPAALAATRRHKIDVDTLPKGVLVGSVEIVDSRPASSGDAAAACVPADFLDASFSWVLANPQRFPTPQTVRFLPYGVWFYPYHRRNGAER